MPVGRIERGMGVSPLPEEAFPAIEKLKRPIDESRYRDTLALSDAVWGHTAPIATSTLRFFENELSPKGFSNEQLGKRPKLQTPVQFDASKVETDINNFLVHRVQDEDSPLHEGENSLERQLLEAMRSQRDNRAEGNLITGTLLQQRTSAINEERKEYFSLQDEIIARKNVSSVIGWFDSIFNVGLLVAGVASVVVTIATSGAALPAVLAVLSGGLGVAKGATTIANGAIKYDSNRKTGQMIEHKETREILREKAGQAMTEMKESEEKSIETIILMRQLQEKKHEAAKQA